MASRMGRRSRALDSDDEDSRPNTPSSTAPNDSKRLRKAHEPPSDSSSSSSADEAPPTMTPSAPTISRRTQVVTMPTSGVAGKPGHLPGAIVRVKLTNFVTYTSAEFFPGPNLNMVIGPNGTGKSTLVCAICLGLGWPPSVSAARAAVCHPSLTVDSTWDAPRTPSSSSSTAPERRPSRSSCSERPRREKTPSSSG